MSKSEEHDGESLVIDPEAMNIVNRVAPGSCSMGEIRFNGGVLVEGRIEGVLHVTGGPIVLMPGGEILGTVHGDGDAILAGTVHLRGESELSEIEVHGTVFMAETLIARANITASAFKTYTGAQIDGRIKTLVNAISS